MTAEKEKQCVNGRFAFTARPFTALLEGARFLANIQDTAHFFRMTDAVDGRQNEVNFQRYIRTPIGAKLNAELVNFITVFADRDALRRYPEGTLADAYLDFMSREELDATMLMGAEEEADSSNLHLDPPRRVFMYNGIATHDVLHVVLGYGRDAIGEACLLAFTAEQFDLSGVGLMAHALGVREQARNPGLPVFGMLGEAKRIARNAVWIPEIDWRDYLGKPVSESRKALNIDIPKTYLNRLAPSTPISFATPAFERAA